MKALKFFYLFVFILIGFLTNSQNLFRGLPSDNFLKDKTSSVITVKVNSPDMDKIRKEDAENDQLGYNPRVGMILPVNFNTENSGLWSKLDNGGKIWQLAIYAKDALAINCYYDKFYLPEGSFLYLYNKDKTQIIGPLSSEDNPEYDVYATDLIKGDYIYLELYLPVQVNQNEVKPIISLSGISYNYRNVAFYFNNNLEKTGFGSAASCTININCSEGSNWQDQKRGVARLYMKLGNQTSWCSGTIVNNTNRDLTPYLLTAEHCADYNGQGAAVSPSDLHQWIFNFNYEASACSNPSQDPYNQNTVVVGGTFKAQSNLIEGSDFYLILLDKAIPTSINAYFNGWSRETSLSPNGAVIHHAMGDIKKICLYSSPIENYANPFGSKSTHFGATWSKGICQEGSSGSPLFNNNKLVIGQLSGGPAYNCTSGTPMDLFGRFYYSWDKSGSNSTSRLKDWLDPAGTDVITLEGTYTAGTPALNAAFTSDKTTVIVGSTVSFTDLSTGGPAKWNWSFQGGTPSSSSQQNPVITYNTAGTYQVSLTISKGSDTDTETKAAYINVISNTGGDCDMLPYPTNDKMKCCYKAGKNGYITGTNAYGDLAKANLFQTWSPFDRIVQLGFGFVIGKGNSSTQITWKIWKANGTTPGAVITSGTISLGTIKSNATNKKFTIIDLMDTPVTITGPFFVGFEIPQTSGDSIAVNHYCDGETDPNIAYEQLSDGTWQPFSTAQPTGWEFPTSLNILVGCCWGTINTNNSLLNNNELIRIFPNPANNNINLLFKDYQADNLEVKLYNLFGSCIKTKTYSNSNNINLDVSVLPTGVYFINIRTKNINITKRISIIR